jgi:flagellar hook-length control protein FliK
LKGGEKDMEIKQAFLRGLTANGNGAPQEGVSNNAFAELFNRTSTQARSDGFQRRNNDNGSGARNESGASTNSDVRESRRSAATQREQSASNQNTDSRRTRTEESNNTAAPREIERHDTQPVVEELACNFDVPEETIAQALNALNMEVYDLSYKDNMQKFVQVIYEADSLVALLDIEGISDKLKYAKETMKQYEGLLSEELSAKDTAEILSKLESEGRNTGQANDTMSELQKPILDYAVAKQGVTVVEAQYSLRDSAEVVVEENAQTETMTLEKGNEQTEQQSGSENFLNYKPNSETKQPEIVIQKIQQENAVQFARMAAAKATNANSNTNTQNIIDQIVEKMKVDVRGNLTEMKIILKPEYLGELTLRIKTDNGIVTAHFMAESQRVKEIIESNFNSLKNVLEEQGIAISDFTVSVDQNSQEQRWKEFLFNQEKSARRISQILKNNSEEAAIDEVAATVDIPSGATVDLKA